MYIYCNPKRWESIFTCLTYIQVPDYWLYSNSYLPVSTHGIKAQKSHIRLDEISSRIIMNVCVWLTQLNLEHCFLPQWNILSIPAILSSERRSWNWSLSCCEAWIVPERGASPDSSEGAGLCSTLLSAQTQILHQGVWPGQVPEKRLTLGSLRISLG